MKTFITVLLLAVLATACVTVTETPAEANQQEEVQNQKGNIAPGAKYIAAFDTLILGDGAQTLDLSMCDDISYPDLAYGDLDRQREDCREAVLLYNGDDSFCDDTSVVGSRANNYESFCEGRYQNLVQAYKFSYEGDPSEPQYDASVAQAKVEETCDPNVSGNDRPAFEASGTIYTGYQIYVTYCKPK